MKGDGVWGFGRALRDTALQFWVWPSYTPCAHAGCRAGLCQALCVLAGWMQHQMMSCVCSTVCARVLVVDMRVSLPPVWCRLEGRPADLPPRHEGPPSYTTITQGLRSRLPPVHESARHIPSRPV